MTFRKDGFEEAARELADAIQRSVARCVEGKGTVAIAFSGGLDSSVLVKCALGRTKVVACSAFSPGAGDSVSALRAAKLLGVELKTKEITDVDVAISLRRMRLPFQPTLMDKSLWSLYSLVAKLAGDSGAKTILLGQLADELFGGYAKYVEAQSAKGDEEAKLMMSQDLRDYESRGKVRDFGACEPMVRPELPFEAAEVVGLASTFPIRFKIRDGVRKAVLRRAAVMLGVPEEIAGAAKKAAQYSSGVQKVVAASHF